ncbi:2-hydroxyacyl-CoA dehydratase, partial [Klebsiella pneumoniae]|uniref:2-hydroxyacyl-CoA dehydratase n=1 Tax=Klebsiella pneumoniae TaxID=573 RepID=UPI003EDEFB8F
MSLITDLPAIFDQFSEARQKGFLTVMDLKEQNVPLVGTYCTFMPQEIAMAAGAVVVSLCSTSDETIEEAEKDLPRNLCPLIKSSYGFGKTDKCPYFYFSDLVVFALYVMRFRFMSQGPLFLLGSMGVVCQSTMLNFMSYPTS